MKPKPLEIRRMGTSGLSIQWDDGVSTALSSERLRLACPCAGCREARGENVHDKPISQGSKAQQPPKKSLLKVVDSTLEEELRLESVWAVGQYAVGVQWGDGHATGIYTYEYLRELGAQKELHTQ